MSIGNLPLRRGAIVPLAKEVEVVLGGHIVLQVLGHGLVPRHLNDAGLPIRARRAPLSPWQAFFPAHSPRIDETTDPLVDGRAGPQRRPGNGSPPLHRFSHDQPDPLEGFSPSAPPDSLAVLAAYGSTFLRHIQVERWRRDRA
jgi:hypothetical protein